MSLPEYPQIGIESLVRYEGTRGMTPTSKAIDFNGVACNAGTLNSRRRDTLERQGKKSDVRRKAMKQ